MCFEPRGGTPGSAGPRYRRGSRPGRCRGRRARRGPGPAVPAAPAQARSRRGRSRAASASTARTTPPSAASTKPSARPTTARSQTPTWRGGDRRQAHGITWHDVREAAHWHAPQFTVACPAASEPTIFPGRHGGASRWFCGRSGRLRAGLGGMHPVFPAGTRGIRVGPDLGDLYTGRG